jgi:hypothetical protein
VVFRPIDGTGSSDTATLITLTTDSNGNAKGSDKTFATSGKVGSGNFVVQSDGLDQFVTGFQIK